MHVLTSLLGKTAPEDVSNAAQTYVRRLMDRDGTDIPQLMAANPDATAGEAIGDAGETALGTLGARPGATGDVLNDLIAQRKSDRGARVLGAVADAFGISPDAAQGSIDALVKQGREDAEPLYQEAYAKGPVWNEKLAQLSQTDAGKTAMQYARKLMSNEMKDPEALGMDFMEDPEQWASYEPAASAEAEPERNPVGFAGVRGPAKPPTRGPSLMQFLASKGGVEDAGGELSAMGADQWHVGKPFQPKFVGWINPEDAAQYAFESGYFPARQEAPSVNELYDSIGQEMRGKPIYAREQDPAALERFNRANAAEEMAYRGGDPGDVPSPDQYVGRPAPTSEPVLQHVPNAQTIDYVKRGFDQQLAPYNSGKLEPDDLSRSINNVRTQWLQEARALNPAYGAALDRAGDYLSSADAFKRGGLEPFNSRIGPTRFADVLKQMEGPQLLAYRAGMANRIYNDVLAARTQPTGTLNTLQTPMVQTKLEMLLGQKRARGLAGQLAQESRMKGFEDYWGPRANSRTQKAAAAMADQDQQGFAQRVGGGLMRNLHRGPVRGPLAALGYALEPAWNNIKMPGMTEPVRDAAGRLLTGSGPDLAAALQAAPSTASKPSALKGMLGAGRRAAANVATRQLIVQLLNSR